MKKSRDSTQPCRSQTPTVNGHDLILPTRTQTSELEYSDLTANSRRPSATLLKAFRKEPDREPSGVARPSAARGRP